MAVTAVQAATGSFNSKAFPLNTTTGNAIVALLQWADTVAHRTLNSVTDSVGGNAYTIVGLSSLASSPSYTFGINAAIAYCIGATGGTTPTVTANYSAAPNTYKISIFELTPCLFDQAAAPANGVGTAISAGSLTPPVDGCFGICGAITDDGAGAGGGWTKGTGWDTLLQNTGGGNAEEGCEYVAQVTAAALAGAFTQSRSGTWAASYATFKPSAATYSETLLNAPVDLCANPMVDIYAAGGIRLRTLVGAGT